MNLNDPGFFGTNADLLSDISVVLGILVAFTLTVGMIMAVRKRFKVHRWIQTSAVVLNILLIIFVMVGSFQKRAQAGIPERLDEAYYQIVVVHAVLGFVAALFGTYVMLRGNELVPNSLKFKNYKPFMRTAYGLYMLVTLLGLSTYYTWYIVTARTVDVIVSEGEGAVQLASEVPGELAVPIANFSFNPGELVIPVGTTLVWTNQDGAPHTVTSDDGVFGSDLLGNADVFSFTFDETGAFPYFCEIHGSAGGFGMTGSIKVVPADEAPEQLVAAVPGEIQSTPQPTPHPLPDVYFDQPTGTAAFRDKNARSDALLINLTLDKPLAADNVPFAFLIAPDDSPILTMGQLSVEADAARLDFAAPNGENLAGRYNRLLISEEPANSDPSQPSGPTLFEAELPEEAFAFITQLLDDGPGLPIGNAGVEGYSSAGAGTQGYVVGIRNQTDELLLHTSHVAYGLETENEDGTRRHAEHVFNIIAGSQAAQFGDVNGDGSIQNPGDGFGLLPNGTQAGYLMATIEAAQAAIDAPDSTEAIRAHAEHVRISAENLIVWAEEARDLAFQLGSNPSNISSERVGRLDTLTSLLVFGNDLNNDGAIAPVLGEGGAIVAYEHAQFMAGFALAAPGVQVSSEADEPGGAPAEVAIDMFRVSFSEETVSIPVGTTVTWTHSDGPLPHTVTADSGLFVSGTMKEGETFTFTFTETGQIPFYCEFHGAPGGVGMSGTIIVTE